MSTQAKPFLTPEEYLEIERKAEFKSEYYQGVMYAMSGARRAHNIVLTHVLRDLDQQLRSSPCEVYPSDMRVRVSDTSLYAYPDAIVVCGEPKFVDGEFDTLINPAVIVEVLSASTEAYDRGAKFDMYQTIDSLQEYLLLSTDYPHADLLARRPDGDWILKTSRQLEDVIELQSVGCQLKLGDLYEKVTFIREPGGRMRPMDR